ncbi:hypothetical protein D3C73_1195980 [compost metagenome]
MLFQACHKLIDVADKILGFAHLLQFGVICLVCDVSGIILDVDDHGIKLCFIQECKQCFHPRAAGAVCGDIDAFDFGCIGLRVCMNCAVCGSG